MNINALLGTISFVLWTSFSVWFYVNNIYEFDTSKDFVTLSKPIEKEVTKKVDKVNSAVQIKEKVVVVKEELTVTTVSRNIEKTEVTELSEPKLAAINIEKEFIFYKNSDKVVDQVAFDNFIQSIAAKIADRKVNIQIVGYTCDLGTKGFNDQLGLKRANAVAKVLNGAKTKDSIVEINSKGELEPFVPNDSEENRSKNRRVSIIISSVS